MSLVLLQKLKRPFHSGHLGKLDGDPPIRTVIVYQQGISNQHDNGIVINFNYRKEI